MVAANGRLRRARATVANDRAMHPRGLGWLEVECNRCKTRAYCASSPTAKKGNVVPLRA